MLFPAILLFCAIGVYSVNNASFDVLLTAGFGLFGYALLKLGFEPAPMLMGLILGPMMEENMRRAMTVSRGDPTVFIQRPLSAALLAIAAALLLVVVLPTVRRGREKAFQD
jgi:putative tricarboxylic transport membrane protein